MELGATVRARRGFGCGTVICPCFMEEPLRFRKSPWELALQLDARLMPVLFPAACGTTSLEPSASATLCGQLCLCQGSQRHLSLSPWVSPSCSEPLQSVVSAFMTERPCDREAEGDSDQFMIWQVKWCTQDGAIRAEARGHPDNKEQNLDISYMRGPRDRDRAAEL